MPIKLVFPRKNLNIYQRNKNFIRLDGIFSILLNMCIDSCMTKYDWILLSTSMLFPLCFENILFWKWSFSIAKTPFILPYILLYISHARSPEEIRHYFLTNLMHPTHLIILFPHGMSPSLLTVSFLNYSNDRISHVTLITWTKRDKSHWMVLAIPAFHQK